MSGESKPTVVEALSAVMEEVQAVHKGERNSSQGYNFRGIDAVVNAVGPVLRKHKVIVTPVSVEASYRDVQTSNGKPSRECTIKARYRFYGPAGDYIEAEAPGESMDFGDKGAPKAMSVAFRILLLQALCIPTDEPDADSQSYERENHRPENVTRSRPSAPAEDEWTNPVPVDAAWLEDARKRLTLATTTAEVEALVTEARRKVADRSLPPDLAAAFKSETDQRLAELKPQAVTA